jgi:hypothetical protein
MISVELGKNDTTLMLLCCSLVAPKDTYYLRLEEFKDILRSMAAAYMVCNFFPDSCIVINIFIILRLLFIIKNPHLT